MGLIENLPVFGKQFLEQLQHARSLLQSPPCPCAGTVLLLCVPGAARGLLAAAPGEQRGTALMQVDSTFSAPVSSLVNIYPDWKRSRFHKLNTYK